jgi:cytochrome c553
MLRSFSTTLLFLATAVTGAAVPAATASQAMPPEGDPMGDPQAGQAAATVCSACHGQAGKAILPSYPNLGGQHYTYLLKQLRYFKSGERYAQLMAGQVDNLPDETLRDLAAFYASKDKPEGVAEGEALALGEQIYRAGIVEKGVPSCTACHSPRGLGNGPAAFPVLSGQNAEYTAAQLKAYRAGERQTDESLGGMMRGVAQNLNDEEIAAVSAYVQGLH